MELLPKTIIPAVTICGIKEVSSFAVFIDRKLERYKLAIIIRGIIRSSFGRNTFALVAKKAVATQHHGSILKAYITGILQK